MGLFETGLTCDARHCPARFCDLAVYLPIHRPRAADGGIIETCRPHEERQAGMGVFLNPGAGMLRRGRNSNPYVDKSMLIAPILSSLAPGSRPPTRPARPQSR